MFPCMSEGAFAVTFSSSKAWHTVRREQREGSAPLSSRALGACGVWAVTERPCPAGSPGGCAGCRGCFGQHSQRLFPVHPCPARMGAWDASQMKTQAASPSVDIISEGVQCHAEKGSCCPSCPASRLPEQLERFWHRQENTQPFLASGF